ncbi:type II toxin-antitoxin system RelE/ParE family toxin [Burkholderia sp. AU16741]|uniref:type II toxin-antitoxin system RelE/ParE family toxin n=1 Tax=Burkholderia sp. AU16741 TaxID=2015347 RepID=UPI00117CA56A|nr:type II toxin-antitoxin system RelE/ParE family toxin [Burkholderia sp. AU16741]
MARVELHPDAQEDLRQLAKTELEFVKKLLALIQQLNCDPKLRDRLLEHGYGQSDIDVINVKKWLRLYNKERKDLWRFRPLGLGEIGLGHRVFYAYHWRSQCFHVLAIVHRNLVDYDSPAHPLAQRIRRAYDGL